MQRAHVHVLAQPRPPLALTSGTSLRSSFLGCGGPCCWGASGFTGLGLAAAELTALTAAAAGCSPKASQPLFTSCTGPTPGSVLCTFPGSA